ncbi:MAG TPA: sulfotransferase [Solirubrobacteraceae bacterium]
MAADRSGRSVLARLRTGLLADPELTARARAATDGAEFTRLVLRAAGERGWTLDRAEVAEAVSQARRERVRLRAAMTGSLGGAILVGVGQTPGLPVLCQAAEVAGCAPIGIGMHDGEIVVEWCDLRGLSFDEPFFELTISRALTEPYRQLSVRWTGLDALLSLGDGGDPAPDCLIFHVSRCGSTLLSRVLGTLPGARAISEAPAIDDLIRAPGIDAATRTRALRALVGALGRVEPAVAEIPAGPRIVKLDAWAILDLELLREAFPNARRVFLYRDPREVIASQMRMRGTQMIPGLFGRQALADASLSGEEYCAAVLDRFADAALSGLGDRDLLVAYDELPGAVLTRVMPHIGVAPSASAAASIRATAAGDAKTPGLPFERDRHAAERPITQRIEAAARRLAWSSYERLECRRRAQVAGERVA